MSEPTPTPAARAASSSTPLAVVGVLLIVAPIIATVLKVAFPGWALVIMIFTGLVVVLAAGYAMQIVIAVTGFLSRRAVFAASRGRRRATIASWITSVSLLLTVFFLPEGGDSSYGSIFAILIGGESDTAINDLSSILFFIAIIPWVGGWVWLLVEWIRAIRERRRARAVATPTP